MTTPAVDAVAERAQPSPRELITNAIEQFLNTPTKRDWTVGVDIDANTATLFAVGVRYLGKSPNRKRWTRCSFGAHIPLEDAANLGILGVSRAIAVKLLKNYREYANMPHYGVNIFHKKRRTRSMKGK
jgi:hypothetical protein